METRIHKSIWVVFSLVLMSLPEVAVSIQTIQKSPEISTIWLCLLLGSLGIGMLCVRNKMFPVEEAGF